MNSRREPSIGAKSETSEEACPHHRSGRHGFRDDVDFQTLDSEWLPDTYVSMGMALSVTRTASILEGRMHIATVTTQVHQVAGHSLMFRQVRQLIAAQVPC